MSTLPGAVKERRRDTTEEETARAQPRWLTNIQIAMSVWLAFWMLRCIVSSLHWPLVNDGSVLSYIVFLIDHGRAPYRDIVETSFPGTYLLSWMERHNVQFELKFPFKARLNIDLSSNKVAAKFIPFGDELF